MSIDINWANLTEGPDGAALADSIREFIHDRFQQVTLPRFIRSVKVHSFEFGTVAPEIVIKDVCDPLPDFYEDEGEDDSVNGGEEEHDFTSDGKGQRAGHSAGRSDYDALNAARSAARAASPEKHARVNEAAIKRPQPKLDTRFRPGSSTFSPLDAYNPFLSRASTPGIPGGTSNLGYFHLPLGAGLSGTTTPLAAVAGAQFGAGWPDHHNTARQTASDRVGHFWANRPPSPPSESTASDTSIKSPTSSNQDSSPQQSQKKISSYPERSTDAADDVDLHSIHEKNVSDVQIVSRIRYSGDIKLSLTADILLDYPMPSFVGIPLKLNVTGMTFDGVAILAHIRNKAHFCFLSPEDADALVDGELDLDINSAPFKDAQQAGVKHGVGGLFEEIKVESEIGQGTNGKQVLKNVGKVEKFVLEQVRRIFENEFVYPSFWTFLV